MSPDAVPHHRVIVVGTGFSGLGMAIRLAQRGEEDYVVLEKAEDVGGTWRDNRYPGCACDVPSRLYSFSFAQNPSWSREFAPAGEIWTTCAAAPASTTSNVTCASGPTCAPSCMTSPPPAGPPRPRTAGSGPPTPW